MVVGAQFGDEGKGKIVDFLAEKVDMVVRYNGGSNAGHTVKVGNKVFKFHLIPSGAVRGKKVVCSGGMVINPQELIEEIRFLERRGIEPDLVVSLRAHVTLPYHPVFDRASEKRKGEEKIGTTGKGIGPTYSDKMKRVEAIRIEDLVSNKFKEKISKVLEAKKKWLIEYGAIKDKNEIEKYKNVILNEYTNYGEKLKKYVGDDSLIINEALDQGKKVLFEGAQGTLLDVDHGTYPYVTSSNAVAGGACTGAGVGPNKIKRIIGVAKAYTTRVGRGPFPTELKEETGDLIREKGGEYGTTTGRPRRCGWLDILILNYAKRVNGLTELALTKLDVLSGITPLKICVAYNLNGKKLKNFPVSTELVEKCKPKYVELEGWSDLGREEWREIAKKGYDALPQEAKNYVEEIERRVNLPIKIISVGPGREETIEIKKELKSKREGI